MRKDLEKISGGSNRAVRADLESKFRESPPQAHATPFTTRVAEALVCVRCAVARAEYESHRLDFAEFRSMPPASLASRLRRA